MQGPAPLPSRRTKIIHGLGRSRARSGPPDPHRSPACVHTLCRAAGALAAMRAPRWPPCPGCAAPALCAAPTPDHHAVNSPPRQQRHIAWLVAQNCVAASVAAPA